MNNPMLTISLWHRQRLDAPKKAHALLDLFVKRGGALSPDRFGETEPVRQKLAGPGMATAAKLLADEGRSGWILLKGPKHKFVASLRWSTAAATEWFMQLNEEYLAKPANVEALIEFLAMLCREYPIVYGGVAPQAEWEAKNWIIERSEAYDRTVRVGVDVESCLPGIYSITVFGPEAVHLFGREKLSSLPSTRAVDLGAAGLILVVRDRPLDGALKDHLRQDADIIAALGPDYFFDLARPDRRCKPIAATTELADGNAPAVQVEGKKKAGTAKKPSGSRGTKAK
jgi:hypothetical protein